MCGIAGMIDMTGQRNAPSGVVRRMADAIFHRGPDEDGYLDRPGLGLGSRRLSIVGLADGRQPITNEDQTIWTVFNGEFFDYPETKAHLQAKGHIFRTHTDTELIPHLWEEYGEGMFEHLRGQFAFCLWDSKKNILILARDRMGICPLFWSVQRNAHGTNWLFFASEMKALLASGYIDAKPDLKGVNQIFSFFAVPGPVTCFEGINLLLPGRYLKVQLGSGSPETAIQKKTYWEIDFPDWGQEENPSTTHVVEDFEKLFLAAVERRLRADVPVVSYLSGGVDSSIVVAVASKVLGRPIPTFTIGIQSKGMNEELEAAETANHVGTKPLVVKYGASDVRENYPELINAAEVPVVDTSCAALMVLAKSVRENGYKVALTGEGADETMAGYSWFKIHKILSKLDLFGLPISMGLRNFALWITGQPRFPKDAVRRAHEVVGGHNGWLDLYGIMSLSKLRFYREDLRQTLALECAYDSLDLNVERLKKWHPFNRSLYLGQRIMLPGHLLCSKGDRVAMNASVETRYPFLDEAVVAFLAKLHPRWKLRGLRDKYLERLVAERWLPKQVAWRKKAMFRAPLDSFHLSGPNTPKWIEQVLSTESLKKTGLFDAEAVQYWRTRLPKMWKMLKRTSVELGLVAVTATQLWHHIYISGDLADLPSKVGSYQSRSNIPSDEGLNLISQPVSVGI
jgi:asparagine synthase (glutamine-hydrolysing)